MMDDLPPIENLIADAWPTLKIIEYVDLPRDQQAHAEYISAYYRKGQERLRRLAAKRDEAGLQMFFARERLYHHMVPGYGATGD